MELRNLLIQDCGSCHGLTMRGGLGPALLPETLQGKPRDYLSNVILEGRPGTAMPGWSPLLSARRGELDGRYVTAGWPGPGRTTMKQLTTSLLLLLLVGSGQAAALRGSGDLGLIIERADSSIQIIETTGNTSLGRVDQLGDLSHASAVYSRDARYAYIFGRDGGLSKVDILGGELVMRKLQSGNSIGGAISQDGRLVAVSNYKPGGVKVFDADTLELVADIPATYGTARNNVPKSSGWLTRPGTSSCLRCGTPTKSGYWTCLIRANPDITKFKGHRPQPLRRADYTRRPLLHCRFVRRRRHGAAGLVESCPPAYNASCRNTARANRNSRSTRCPTSRVGRLPATSPSCPQSGATKCW